MRLHQIDGNIVVPLHFAQYKKQRLNSNIDNRLHSKFLTVSAATHSTTTLYCDYVLSYSSAAALPFVLRSLLQLLFDFISVWVCMRNNFFFLFCFVCHRQCRWRSCWYWRDRTEWNMTSKNSKIYFICVHRTAVTAPQAHSPIDHRDKRFLEPAECSPLSLESFGKITSLRPKRCAEIPHVTQQWEVIGCTTSGYIKMRIRWMQMAEACMCCYSQ